MSKRRRDFEIVALSGHAGPDTSAQQLAARLQRV